MAIRIATTSAQNRHPFEVILRRDIVAIARAYLKTASLAAMLMQLIELTCIQCFGTRETIFETARCRLLVAAEIVAFVGAARLVSYLAYVYTKNVLVVRTVKRYESLPKQSLAVLRFLYDLHLRYTGAAKVAPSDFSPKS
ncbi:hypothetical protein BG58_30870 [Caballeronia jiangsuensis]|nr:hypothetical protein BG58_30870 [Caballeronia jiangsuensis]